MQARTVLSLLFERPLDSRYSVPLTEATLKDLHIEKFVNACTAGREAYELDRYYLMPVWDEQTVLYRQEVMGDVANPSCSATIRRFSEQMRHIQGTLDTLNRIENQNYREGWLIDAIIAYCQAVKDLASGLRAANNRSRALNEFLNFLTEYLASKEHVSLAEGAAKLRSDLAEVRYTIHIRGNRVSVGNYDGEPDYSAEVEETFVRFKQGEVKSHLTRFPERDMNHVQAQILDRVARLNDEVFSRLHAFCQGHWTFIDEHVYIFDREIQFYMGFLDATDLIRQNGLPFCLPVLIPGWDGTDVEDTFDLVLALTKQDNAHEMILNNFFLNGGERILVVTGPNQGGKTTFARSFGLIHYLAALGLMVPGTSAHLRLPDRVLTHFEREESLNTMHGKLEDELVRAKQVIDALTDRTAVIMNETFGSTTLDDSLFLGKMILEDIIDIGAGGVYVSFVDELTALSTAIVSMVATVEPDDPSIRTMKIVRQPADGLAYADAIASKYGLSYETVKERLSS